MSLFKKIIILLLLVIASLVAVTIMAVVALMPSKPKFSLDDPAAATKLDTYFSQMNEKEFKQFNGVVLIRKGQTTLLKKGYGIDGFGRALGPDSALRLASVSKQFTAVGVLTLVENNRVKLTDPISKYIKGCDFESTIASLLNHTSGIPDNYLDIREEDDDFVTNADVVNYICKDGVSLIDPGKYNYSNTGYVILARLVEIVTGETFEDYMKSTVFEPLGLSHTRVWNLASSDDFPQRAAGFDSLEDEPTPVALSHWDGVSGDGGVFSSLNDMENWARFWTDDRLISKYLKTLAMTGKEEDYGFGLVQEGNVIWHDGYWLAANSYFYLNTENEDLIVIIDNGDHVYADKIMEWITDMVEAN